MYTYEEKIAAVKLLLQYNMKSSKVRRELGYPAKTTLFNWYNEYKETGDLSKEFRKTPVYSQGEKQKALDFYISNGENIIGTARALGYPCRATLSEWVKEKFPKREIRCSSRVSPTMCTQEQREQALVDFCSKSKSSKEIASELGIARETLYNWKMKYLEGSCAQMPEENHKKSRQIKSSTNQSLSNKAESAKESLLEEIEDLKKEIYRLRLERDILEKATEVIKKDEGIDIKNLTNREKAIIINALREKYPLKELLLILTMAKSSYCYQASALQKPDKHQEIRAKTISIFNESFSCYGYRRIHSVLKTSGKIVSEKVVRRIMKEESLAIPYNKKKKYSSYAGEISPAPDNILKRDFYAEQPNEKWLTDLTEFHIPAGKVYLSPIIDCFDELPLCWSIGTSPNADLVNSMLDEAITTLKPGERPILHTDRGSHYRWPGWIERIANARLVRSMSQKANCADNAACEGFFGRLKNEFFYGRIWKNVSIEDFIKQLDEYLRWYGEKRIKISLGGVSPLEYRKGLGLVI